MMHAQHSQCYWRRVGSVRVVGSPAWQISDNADDGTRPAHVGMGTHAHTSWISKGSTAHTSMQTEEHNPQGSTETLEESKDGARARANCTHLDGLWCVLGKSFPRLALLAIRVGRQNRRKSRGVCVCQRCQHRVSSVVGEEGGVQRVPQEISWAPEGGCVSRRLLRCLVCVLLCCHVPAQKHRVKRTCHAGKSVDRNSATGSILPRQLRT